MNKVLREEKKFLLGIDEFRALSGRLEKLLHEDTHNGDMGYTVRSLYYDTPYDTDFFEKSSGIEIRRKIRLRIYDPKQDFAMLEMKQKQGSMQLKRSLKVTREDAYSLIRGDLSCILKYDEPFASEIYAFMNTRCYRPCTIVEYRRKAFVAWENSTRITFDNHISSTESSLDLFDEHLNMNPVLDPFYVVLEVKYNGFLLDYIKRLINCVDKSELSVSKYYLARQNACQTHM